METSGGILHLRGKPAWVALLVIPLIASVIGLLLVSLVRPIFLTRTLIWTAIPLYITVDTVFSTSGSHS